MIRCPKYKIYLDENFEGNCPVCIFWDKIKKKCNYKDWNPGLKNGKPNESKS